MKLVLRTTESVKIEAMAKKIKLELTEAQFSAMVDLADTISAQRGCDLDFTKEADKNLRLFDNMLKKNGYKRRFK